MNILILNLYLRVYKFNAYIVILKLSYLRIFLERDICDYFESINYYSVFFNTNDIKLR